MKHLFYIHSYITYFVSQEVIKYKDLNADDCVFMYDRGFKPTEPADVGMVTVIPFTHYPHSSFPIIRQFWKSWPRLRRFDSFVQQLRQGEDFHLYINQTSIDFIRLFMSHGNCRGYSFIEEGLYSYYTCDHMNTILCPPVGKPSLFYKLLILLNYRGRLGQRKYFLAPGYDAVFGINEKVFPGFRDRNILPYPFNKIDQSAFVSDQAVLVMDSFLDYGVIEWNLFENALQKAFSYFHNNNIKKLHIKLHPKQHENAVQLNRSRVLIQKFQGDIVVEELGQEQSLELLAANATAGNLDFYVFFSSAALYAALCGTRAYSFAPFLAEEDPAFRNRIDTVPQLFKDLVCFIDNPDRR